MSEEKISPFDIAKRINEKLGVLDQDQYSAYSPWMINKIFSMTRDTVLFSNEMNQNYHLEKEAQFDFYYYGLDKKKRYGKWQKKDAIKSSVIDLIKKKFNYSNKKAHEVADLLSKEDIAKISSEFYTGGQKR